MNFADVLRGALFSLRGNWLRSALTSLGVIIGIAAVIVMVSVGQGVQSQIDSLISRLGSNRLDVMSGAGGFGGVRSGAGTEPTLTDGDVEAVRREIPEAQYVTGVLRGGTQIVRAESNWQTQWYGVEPDYFPINGLSMALGAEFDTRDYGAAAKVVILGETVRQNLFGDEDPVGQQVRVGRVPFRVVGVLASRGQAMMGMDQDDIIVVPLETARRRLSGAVAVPPGTVQSITLGVGRVEDLTFVEMQVGELLRQRHRIRAGEVDDFNVRNVSQMVSTRTDTTRLMSLLLGAVAAISLVVGGIGIMNIMLVSVTERIREIGLRMAVGGGPRAIRMQFLAEAMLISVGGGLIGIALGAGGSLLAQSFGTLPVVLGTDTILLATVFSVGTGLFFGYYPARKAAELDPIEALRHQG